MENNEIIKYEGELIKRVGSAISITNKLLNFDINETADFYYRRGCENSNLNKFSEAIEDFTKAISIDPAFANAYSYRGFAKNKTNRYTEAIDDYTKGFELNMNEMPYYFYTLRGSAYKSLENYSAAVEDYSKSIELNPQYVAAYNGRGLSNQYLMNYAAAIEDFSKSIKIDESYYYGFALYHRANVKYKIGDKSACEDWHKARDFGNPFAEKYITKHCS